MKHWKTILSLVLVLMLSFAAAAAVPAFADEANQSGMTELTGLVLKDVDAPIVGRPLDQTATVASAEGVSWEIPVIWVDQNGNEATIAEAGKGYLPTFAFFVPEGFTVKADENGVFAIKLPAFLENLLGSNNLLFVVDKDAGITYITFNLDKVKVIYSYNPAYDNTGSSGTPSTPAIDKEVELHCSKKAIESIGENNLKDLVYLIKNVIEPRAVAALLDGFPAFAEGAEKGEIGTKIGLYIYNENVESRADDDRNKDGALAYVGGAYDDEGVYFYRFCVNAASLYELKDGEMVPKESEFVTLENTITHEFMHAMMDDYVRTGMASVHYDPSDSEKDWNRFPGWFCEGSATAIENGFQFGEDTFNKAKAADGKFTTESISTSFRGENNQYHFDRDETGTPSAKGNYGAGSLAIIYLSKLVAQSEADGNTITSAEVRNGLNTILKELHNGTPLDTIIKNTGSYDGIHDFEAKFLGTEDPSTVFVAAFLNRLDAVGGEGERATGSILLDFDSTATSILEGRTEDSSTQKTMVIGDDNDYIESTVTHEMTKTTAGVFDTWNDARDFGTQQANAAKENWNIAEGTSKEAAGVTEDAQEANDFAGLCERFEKKLYDLELTRAICLQNAPQIRLVQTNAVILSDKIQSTLVNTLPLWKNQMVIALGMAHSKEAIKAQQAVTNATNEILSENAEMLHQSTVEIATENERGVVDIETLQHTNEELIATLDDLIRIQDEGREKRRNAEIELTNIEMQLKERLTQAGSMKV